ncbi:DUF4145 domain-containing protein [Methylobacterium soli]|uniref:DUF4145 domain-containing protein n=1 Tax=Methylobacterium soli TaxID=553447 RepID=A0A6L3T129_9HYPH|nr:DUF4145 domain-containing protein [Methylobacterium soli]KAB1080191.1 DUF4145 domain-containing protein [Methylobacterium soli]
MSDAGIDAEQVGKLDEALIELYGALNNDLYILAGIGIRTSFDVASNLLEIDSNLSFQKKLEELEKRGRIGPQDKARLNSLVEAGNASAHRDWKPSADDLNTMMDALEYFVHETFVIPTRKSRVDAKLKKMNEIAPSRQAKK